MAYRCLTAIGSHLSSPWKPRNLPWRQSDVKPGIGRVLRQFAIISRQHRAFSPVNMRHTKWENCLRRFLFRAGGYDHRGSPG